MRLVVFSDLHLDRAFAWAGPAVARQRRLELRRTLENVAALAREVKADVVLCAGDLYEHERVAPDTAAFLVRVFAELDPVRVFLAPGNHDPCTADSLYREAAWSPNVHVFDEPRLRPVALTAGLTLWGGAHVAAAGTANFLDGFRVSGDGVHLGLFHGAERAGLPFEGDGKELHAPFDAAAVPRSGLLHALVGHYHRPRDGDHHTYPGCPMPLDFGAGEPGAAVVLDVEPAPGGLVRRSRRDVAASAAHDVELDLTGLSDESEVLAAATRSMRGRRGVIRLTLTGEWDPAVPLDDDALAGAGDLADAVVVRRGKIQVGYDIAELAAANDVRGEFVRSVLDARLDDDEQRRVLLCGLRALDGRDDLEVR
jgi:DNA repair protein SbcD/Mre11